MRAAAVEARLAGSVPDAEVAGSAVGLHLLHRERRPDGLPGGRRVAGGWQAGDSDRVRRPRVSRGGAGCCGREARRQARARRNGLAEGVVQVAVDQAGLSHARLACAEERHEGGGGVRRPHSARAHSMQAAAAARRARRHPHRRSAAPRQRWPRVRAARRTKEHELQVDGLHRSPHSGRTGSASATWWLLRRQCRATRSAGWRGRRPTTGGTAQLLAAPPRRKMHAPLAQRLCKGARRTEHAPMKPGLRTK